MGKVIVAALIVGVVVAIACDAWRNSYLADVQSASFRSVSATIDGGAPVEDPKEPLPAKDPMLSGLIAALAVGIVGRVVIWGRNVEEAARGSRGRSG